MPEVSCSRSHPLIRLVRSVVVLATLAVVVGIFIAWVWRTAAPPITSMPAAAVGLWSIVLTSFWWQIGACCVLAATVPALLRQRCSAVVLVLTGVCCLSPTVHTAIPQASGSVEPHSDEQAVLRVYSANMLYGRSDLAIIADDVSIAEGGGPGFDVLLFQEVTPEAAVDLREQFSTAYPHSVIEGRNNAFGMATFSRHPLIEPSRTAIPAANGMPNPHLTIGITISVGGVPTDIWNVHTLPPMNLDAVQRQDELCRALADMARASERPMVLAGDFNSPQAGVPMRRLFDAGLGVEPIQPAAWVRPTWPIKTGSLGKVSRVARLIGGTRLDHIAFSDQFVAVSADLGTPNGSDHRAVTATLQLLPWVTDGP